MLGLVGLVFSAALLVLALAELGGADTRSQPSPRSTYSLAEAERFRGYPIYGAGDSVDGLPLVAVLRRNDTADYVSFVYGTCVVESDTGCAPPAEVQTWPACLRSFASYDPSQPGSPVPSERTVRGVPAAEFDGGLRTEIHTGRSLIVVFADSDDRVDVVVRSLRGVNNDSPAEVPLPPPAPGAVEGKLQC